MLESEPRFVTLSQQEKIRITQSILKKAVVRALVKAKLPPQKDLISRQLEMYRYKRASRHFRQIHKITNYFLLDRLRALKAKYKDSLKTDFTEYFDKSGFTNEPLLLDVSPNNNLTLMPQYNYKNYSVNYRSEPKLFKIPDFSDVFSSQIEARNHITRMKFRLENSLKEIFENTVSNQTVLPKKSQTIPKVEDSIFHLYHLSTFLDFIRQLELHVKKTKKHEWERDIDYSYSVLRDYYVLWLQKHNISTKPENVENELLKFDEFTNIDYENPLMQGLEMLMSRSTNYEKIQEVLKSDLFEGFYKNKREHPKETNSKEQALFEFLKTLTNENIDLLEELKDSIKEMTIAEVYRRTLSDKSAQNEEVNTESEK